MSRSDVPDDSTVLCGKALVAVYTAHGSIDMKLMMMDNAPKEEYCTTMTRIPQARGVIQLGEDHTRARNYCLKVNGQLVHRT